MVDFIDVFFVNALQYKNNTLIIGKIVDMTDLKLAVFGQKPLFKYPLPVSRPNNSNVSLFNQYASKILDSHVFTNNGPYVQELEKKIAHYLKVKHCIVTCNGTIALQIILKALDLSGEIIIPSYTFIATAHSVMWQGLKPVFSDVDLMTHNISPKSCESLITDKTSAILGVHLWGRPCEIEILQDIASKYKLKLIFDSAHAFGCNSQQKMIGNFGDAEVFSFHATKVFHTFEGGAITTNDDVLAKKVRNLKNFGFIDYDKVEGEGINGKMTEICAAMGLANLEKFNETLSANENVYDAYQRCFKNIDGLTLIDYDKQEKNNFQYIVVDVNSQVFGLSRDELIEILHHENILARKYFYPGCHNMEPYKTTNRYDQKKFQHTNKLCERMLVMPAGTCMKIADISIIADFLKMVYHNSQLIKKNLMCLKKDNALM